MIRPVPATTEAGAEAGAKAEAGARAKPEAEVEVEVEEGAEIWCLTPELLVLIRGKESICLKISLAVVESCRRGFKSLTELSFTRLLCRVKCQYEFVLSLL